MKNHRVVLTLDFDTNKRAADEAMLQLRLLVYGESFNPLKLQDACSDWSDYSLIACDSPAPHITWFLKAAAKLEPNAADAAKRSALSRITASMRQTWSSGRPPVPTPCLKCGYRCASAREAQAHCAEPRRKK